MAKKILILRWAGSAYDSLGGLLELAAEELALQGHDVLVFGTDDDGWADRLLTLLRGGEIAFALTMSGVGVDAMLDGSLIWDTCQVPLFNWCCDHPCYYPTRHVIRSQHLLHGYVFPDHARYHMAHMRPNGVAYAVHMGIPPRSVFKDAPRPATERNGRLIFTKSGQDTNTIEARWRGFPPELAHVVFAAAEELMQAATSDVLPVLQRIAEGRGLFFDGGSMLAMLLLHELDMYIRHRRAAMVVRSVLAYPVDVFGTGWDHMPWASSRARYGGPLGWRDMVERMPFYAGCLSINPLTQESVHDRVFFALAANVPPISDSNAFSRTNMAELEPYAFAFTPERIRQAVESALADTATAVARTESCWNLLSGPFGLRRSVSQILQFVSMYGLNKPVGG